MNLITPSLLNSWLYYMNSAEEWEDKARQDFLDYLNKVERPTSDVQMEGIKFEEHIRGIRELTDEDERYKNAVLEAQDIVKNGVWGMSVSKEVEIDGNRYLLYGKPDVVRGPTIFDIKWTGNYSYGKYHHNTQHPLYMFCLPEVWNFQYVIFDGLRIHYEFYTLKESTDIRITTSDFISWMENNPEIYETYQTKWRAR